LDRGGDDVIAFIAQSVEHALKGEIIGLAAAARENNLIVVTAKQCCDLAARDLQGSLCLDRSPMPACWIAVVALEKRPHRSRDHRVDRRTGVVIEIDALHGQYTMNLVRLWTEDIRVCPRSGQLNSHSRMQPGR